MLYKNEFVNLIREIEDYFLVYTNSTFKYVYRKPTKYFELSKEEKEKALYLIRDWVYKNIVNFISSNYNDIDKIFNFKKCMILENVI